MDLYAISAARDVHEMVQMPTSSSAGVRTLAQTMAQNGWIAYAVRKSSAKHPNGSEEETKETSLTDGEDSNEEAEASVSPDQFQVSVSTPSLLSSLFRSPIALTPNILTFLLPNFPSMDWYPFLPFGLAYIETGSTTRADIQRAPGGF